MKKRSIIGMPAIFGLVILGLLIAGCDTSGDDTSSGNGAGTGGPYTVSFVTYASGTAPAAQTVAHGEKVSVSGVTDPTTAQGPANNDGFAGWYKNGGVVKWNFATDTVTENITLSAGWKFDSIADLTAFVGNAAPPNIPSAARHTIQGVDPNAGKLPIPVVAAIQLTRENWAGLVNGIEAKNKKVTLDLTPATVGTSTGSEDPKVGGLWANGTFNPLDNAAGYLPNPGTSRVNNTIAGLILPDAATKLYQAPTNLNLCKEIRGNNVTEITTSPSFHGGLMARVYFPKLTDIADALTEAQNLEVAYLPQVTAIDAEAFMWTWKGGAPGVYDVYIPRAASIGDKAFAQSGPGNLTITLGSTPPSLGTKIFDGVTVTKRVTIRVPAAAKAAYTEAWIDGLKGKGWTSSGAGTGSLMRNIVVTIEAQ